ncbi:MAG: DUF3828 domain-containing protein [Hyphomonadaceae bacterium]|nr:DUF3828 domain-containing protein [Hyphomonadaceae bacterium]
MNTRRFFVIGAALALAGACTPPAQEAPEPTTEAPAAAPDPAAIIRPLYERYTTPAAVTTFPALEEQAPWSDDLKAQLLAMMARSELRQEPILDFDPFIDAQDYELSNISVTTDGVVENSHAVVRAHFTNLGRETDVLFDLIWQNDEWRVDNMRGANWELRQIIAS